MATVWSTYNQMAKAWTCYWPWYFKFRYLAKPVRGMLASYYIPQAFALHSTARRDDFQLTINRFLFDFNVELWFAFLSLLVALPFTVFVSRSWTVAFIAFTFRALSVWYKIALLKKLIVKDKVFSYLSLDRDRLRFLSFSRDFPRRS